MSGSLTTSNSQLRMNRTEARWLRLAIKTRPPSLDFTRVICRCHCRSRVCVSDHGDREREVGTFLLFIHLHFPVLKAGADPQETSEGKFTSPVSINTKIAVDFISLVIVDLPFHCRCEVEDARTRSHRQPPKTNREEAQCSEYALSAIPLYLNYETMSFKRDHLFIVYKHGAG